MSERVLHETYREVRPAQPVWVSDDRHHEGRESALLVAWRQAIPGDGRTYWYGLCVTADMHYEELTTVGRWVWEPHILPVPNRGEDQSMAWNRWMDERIRREKQSASPST